MKVNLIGVQNMKKLTMRDGSVIDGVKLHMAYPKDGIVGCFVDSKFIGRETFNTFDVTVEQLEEIAAEGVEVIDVEYGPNNTIVGVSL